MPFKSISRDTGYDGAVNPTSLRSSSGPPNFYDNLGNVSDRLDASQNIVSSDLYDAYGQRLIGTSTDPYGYKGQYGYYTDYETGLALCTYRYYDAANGRWVTRDPIGFAGGINLYGYVKNDPANSIDPSGLRGISNCYEDGKRISDEMMAWPHNHSGDPHGGDKLVHCMAACLLAKENGDLCAFFAGRSTERGGNPFGRMVGDPNDEKAAMDGMRCASYSCPSDEPTHHDRKASCFECCKAKGYRRWQ